MHVDAADVAEADAISDRARYVGFLVALNNLRYGVDASRPVYVRAALRALARGLAEFGAGG